MNSSPYSKKTSRIDLDDVSIVLDTRPGKDRDKSKGSTFVMVKEEGMIDFYKELKRRDGENIKNIMEVGMFEGGSLVFFDKLFTPDKIVGVDIRREPIKPLERYVRDKSHIKTYYGRSQDKIGTLMAARSNFPDGIDLVVDDASHMYAETKATFEMLFPLVRPGGYYIIEDWAWAHQPDHNQDTPHPWHDKPALTNLVFQIVVASACYGVIEEVVVNSNLVCIKKGRGVLPENALDLHGRLRGRELPMI